VSYIAGETNSTFVLTYPQTNTTIASFVSVDVSRTVAAEVLVTEIVAMLAAVPLIDVRVYWTLGDADRAVSIILALVTSCRALDGIVQRH